MIRLSLSIVCWTFCAVSKKIFRLLGKGIHFLLSVKCWGQ